MVDDDAIYKATDNAVPLETEHYSLSDLKAAFGPAFGGKVMELKDKDGVVRVQLGTLDDSVRPEAVLLEALEEIAPQEFDTFEVEQARNAAGFGTW